MIRANQGDSVALNLQLEAIKPLKLVYHGTYQDAVSSIEKQGLNKMSRHHVHLSQDVVIAKKVGQTRASFPHSSTAVSNWNKLTILDDREIGIWLEKPDSF